MCPTEVRLTAINWEWSESLRLSRSCELPYGPEAESHCRQARRHFRVERSQKTSLWWKDADGPRCKGRRRKSFLLWNEELFGSPCHGLFVTLYIRVLLYRFVKETLPRGTVSFVVWNTAGSGPTVLKLYPSFFEGVLLKGVSFLL